MALNARPRDPPGTALDSRSLPVCSGCYQKVIPRDPIVTSGRDPAVVHVRCWQPPPVMVPPLTFTESPPPPLEIIRARPPASPGHLRGPSSSAAPSVVPAPQLHSIDACATPEESTTDSDTSVKAPSPVTTQPHVFPSVILP